MENVSSNLRDLIVEKGPIRNIISNLDFPKDENSRHFSTIHYTRILEKVNSFPNVWIAYIILLTIPITVASAERSFSKLKLIKSFLRSTMSQEILNGLAIISIEKDLVSKLEYKNLINDFASQKVRKVNFN